MQRILLLGISGSGKSTLAKKLGQKLQIPVFHLDQYFWLPGWEMPEQENWETKLKAISSKKEWIMDGNYITSLPILLPQADTILYLDCSRSLALYRVIKRALFPRNDLPLGCKESVNLNFFKFLKYIWDFKKIRIPMIEKALQLYAPEKKVIRLSSTTEIGNFLESVKLNFACK